MEYDPDLPPKLAAAVGIQDIPSKNTNLGKTDVGTKDLTRAHGRPPLTDDDDDVVEQQEDDSLSEDLRDIDETDDLQQDDTDRHHGFSHMNDGNKRDLVGRREKFVDSVYDDEIVEDDILHIPSEEPEKYHPCWELGVLREER
ncbi:FIP1[V]-like protein [Forsythia ovata]|uniref:FIP1[V]-like protein n=1 Tax=Forsythia ovata TaxID=205694 RepID=A0ABD1S1U1_9LAMI